MVDKTFVLGAGAQKSGTTWIWNYLNSRADTDMGFAKEYHIFDAITLEGPILFREKAEERAKILINRGFDGWKNKTGLKRLAFMSDPSLYFDYFVARLCQEGVVLTGDITPSYSGLSAETFQEILDGFTSRNVEVKPFFLLRDPVDRLQSAIRMVFRKQNIKPTLDQEIERMENKQNSKADLIRSDYKNTIHKLDSVFGENVFYCFF